MDEPRTGFTVAVPNWQTLPGATRSPRCVCAQSHGQHLPAIRNQGMASTATRNRALVRWQCVAPHRTARNTPTPIADIVTPEIDVTSYAGVETDMSVWYSSSRDFSTRSLWLHISHVKPRVEPGFFVYDSCRPNTHERQRPMNDQEIEKEIQAKGLTAPRVTPERLEAVIKDEAYHVFPGTMLTVCCLTLENGFTVTGESACASPANFNAELGQKIAREHAKQKIWPLEGYLLRQQLSMK